MSSSNAPLRISCFLGDVACKDNVGVGKIKEFITLEKSK